jgi:hypothetical protein
MREYKALVSNTKCCRKGLNSLTRANDLQGSLQLVQHETQDPWNKPYLNLLSPATPATTRVLFMRIVTGSADSIDYLFSLVHENNFSNRQNHCILKVIAIGVRKQLLKRCAL